MSYVTAIVMQLNSGSKQLALKVRGRMTSQAVDVIEVCRQQFFSRKLNITEVKIGTSVLRDNGEERNASTVEITARRKNKTNFH